jgi:hypothetical protein
MENYLAYWKRGWWAWLMMLCTNIGLLILILPLAFIFSGNKGAYLVASVVAWLAIGAPYLGWFFEQFASRSNRLTSVKVESPPGA